MTAHNWRFFVAPAMIVLLVLLSVGPMQQARADSTDITVPSSTVPVKIDGIIEPGEWNDSQTVTIPTVGLTADFKYNATGLLFLLQWTSGSPDCSSQSCFGGIELGFLNNTAEMGSALTPTVMVLLSPSFKGGSDEFISHGDSTPSTVESLGYKSQSICRAGALWDYLHRGVL